jgi:Immunity protein 53
MLLRSEEGSTETGWRNKIASVKRDGLETSAITKLQDWYHSQCDGDWEHGLGIKIETLDNPGWAFKINLEDTDLEEKQFKGVSYGVGENSETSGDDWIICKVADKRFEAAGGPHKLEEMLQVFLKWKDEME